METVTRQAVRGVAIVAAVLLVGASAGFGVAYAWLTAAPHGQALAGIAVAMALGLELAKPFAIEGAFRAFGAWRFARAVALILAGTFAVAYSLTAELTFQAMMRGDMTASRGAEGNDRRSLEAKAKRIETALAELPKHRPAAVVDVALVTLANLDPGVWARTKGCTAITKFASAEACRPALALQGELAAAREASRLEVELNTVREELAKTGSTGIGAADPGASALAAYAVALGYTIEADRIAPWLPLIAVLALEIGAAFAGVLVASAYTVTAAGEVLPQTIGARLEAATDAAMRENIGARSLEAIGSGLPAEDIPSKTAPLAFGGLSAGEAARAPPVKVHVTVPVPNMGSIAGSHVPTPEGSNSLAANGSNPARSDPSAEWAKVCLARVRKGDVAMVAAHAACQVWCAAEGLPMPSANAFGRAMTAALKRLGGKRAKRQGVIHYRGVTLARDGKIRAMSATSHDTAHGVVTGRFVNGENGKATVRSKAANQGKVSTRSGAAKTAPNVAVSLSPRTGKGNRRALGSSPLKANERNSPSKFAPNGKPRANGHDISKVNGKAHPIAN